VPATLSSPVPAPMVIYSDVIASRELEIYQTLTSSGSVATRAAGSVVRVPATIASSLGAAAGFEVDSLGFSTNDAINHMRESRARARADEVDLDFGPIA
jgi:hypothetical protein